MARGNPPRGLDPPEENVSLLSVDNSNRNNKKLGEHSGSQAVTVRKNVERSKAGSRPADTVEGALPPRQFSTRQRILLILLCVGICGIFFVVIPNAEHSEDEAMSRNSTKSRTSAEYNKNKAHIGFHEFDPALSILVPKPEGAGIPLAPVGGLHRHYSSSLDGEQVSDDDINYYSLYNDDNNSPYADKRLKLSNEERQKEQAEWKQKLKDIRETWGYWDFHDPSSSKFNDGRPIVDFKKVQTVNGASSLSGEIAKNSFPKGSWQTDNEYVVNLLKEGRSLVQRVQEAIYTEYGWSKTNLTPEQLSLRSSHFGIHFLPENEPVVKKYDASVGIVWMPTESFEALAKKLLNAMITNDHFFVTLGGHSAAAGHGNNFHQSYMMQFHEVMEPVFDRLGMVLVSANRAQGGMGTLQAALAGGSIYGEKDFMVWDSSMTEKAAGPQDLFFRQMLLTGHRVPILFEVGGGTPVLLNLYRDVGANVGGMTTGTPPFLEETTSLEQADTLPFALQHLFCANGMSSCNDRQHKYNAKCWVDRVDIVPPKEQSTNYGSQVSWHPGNRSHQWTARKLSLLFLLAFEKAFDLWEEAIASSDEGGNPLHEKYWHLTEEEELIRTAVRNTDVAATECGKFLANKIPRVCSTPMRGATEWTPRANPEQSSIRSLVKPAPNGYVPELHGHPTLLYTGRDVLFPSQRVPPGEVDVPAIARSTPPQHNNRRRSLAPKDHYLQQHIPHIRRMTNSSLHASPSVRGRRLGEETGNVIPGEGWTVVEHPAGFCDGTAYAQCHREPTVPCLMGGHNDARGTLYGDGLSGWLVLQLHDVTQGIVIARIQSWMDYNSNPKTEGWEKENNGRSHRRRLLEERAHDQELGDRRLKKAPPPLPDDFALEIAVNGAVLQKWNKTEVVDNCSQITYNVPMCVLLDDVEMAKKNVPEDIEFGLRITGSGRMSVLGITHVYYA